MRRTLIGVIAAVLALAVIPARAASDDDPPCRGLDCPDPELSDGAVNLRASDLIGPGADNVYVAMRIAAGPVLFTWRFVTPCEISDPATGACDPADSLACPTIEGRVVGAYLVQRQRLAQGDNVEVDGSTPPSGRPIGSPFGPWETQGTRCVDVTDLDPPPSPAEVFRYFQTLPLPQLTTRQQPPGNALVGLPVIFWTDSPTTQTFTVDIRGFQVVIVATASSYTWHTGDGTDLTTDNPGQPYPNQTITHDYRAGTYTASLTTTWSATFTVDGGASADVPGTTTTDGPPVTFTVLQARTVLTNPYD